MNHSRSKSYLKNVIFLSTIPMNHNEQKNESIEYLTMNKFQKTYFNHLIMLLKITANQVSRRKYNKISISCCSEINNYYPKQKLEHSSFSPTPINYTLHPSYTLWNQPLWDHHSIYIQSDFMVWTLKNLIILIWNWKE